jgi:exopolysaccharide biosynthesis polyprenyl glycosylphosphotransferase
VKEVSGMTWDGLTLDDISSTQVDPLVQASSRSNWRRTYVRGLVVGDAAAVTLANLFAVFARFGGDARSGIHGLGYSIIALGIAGFWLINLFAGRAYELRFLGSGSEEYKRVGGASVRLIALVALVALFAKVDLARGFLLISLGVGTGLLLLNRRVARQRLSEHRNRGEWSHRVLIVGTMESVAELVAELDREPGAGLHAVAACVAAAPAQILHVGDRQVPVVSTLSDIATVARRVEADTIAVTNASGITSQVVRRLAWQLEGSDVDLVVAPALTNVAGPRISIRPVAGLPLLHVEEPEIAGVRYLLKEMIERTFAVMVGLLLLIPALVIAALIRADSSGSVLFRQRRVGRNGQEFEVLKFRSMYLNAESRLTDVRERNIHREGPMFKDPEDPRITKTGRWLRRYSIDELPQLWNVIRGQMALIGPRPPLPSEVAVYGNDVKRRLMVKPGMTGLWQVSGRSDLSWEESVRLDLHYVENWSLAMDMMILIRTVRTVLAGQGAY